jgi:hypothetical protein
MPNDLQYFKDMEVAHRHGGALHPDRCPKLRLHGVDFAVPPRGLRVRPRFNAGDAVALELRGVEDWPEIQGLLAQAGKALSGGGLALDLDEPAGLLVRLMSLARKALLRQYDLSDDQAAELLEFATDEQPLWMCQLLRWALGLPAIGS